jgi:outer membrane protein assembly factor BamB
VTSFYASPIVAAGRIYFVDQKGVALVLRQSDKFEVLATNVLDDLIDASPAAVGRQLFLRGEKHLYCIEAK